LYIDTLDVSTIPVANDPDQLEGSLQFKNFTKPCPVPLIETKLTDEDKLVKSKSLTSVKIVGYVIEIKDVTELDPFNTEPPQISISPTPPEIL
jgi:hypothetical protein